MPQNFIYDIDTRNISFIQTASDLEQVGVTNNMFFLILYDTSLRGVDPYSPYLTHEQICRIINECIINPFYFLREICRIPEQGGTGIHYQLNRGNLAALFCYLNGIDHYLVLPRQIGKTQSTIAILLWTFLVGTTNSQFMFINKRHEDANENLDRLKAQRDLLPKYLQFKFSIDEDGSIVEGGTDNVRKITNPNNTNSIVTKPSARSVESAEQIGRGASQPIQFYDEVEFSPFIKTIVESAGPAFTTASAHAKNNGAPYCRILTSTPGDLDTQCGQDAQLIIAETCRWSEKFYDWTKDELEQYVTTNSGSRIVYIEYQYKELGKDENWFIKACQSVLNNPLKIKREIFLHRLHGSSSSPFAQEDLVSIEELKGKIIEEFFIGKLYKFDLYTPLIKNKIYLVGCDVSNGYGQDASHITIFDPYTLEVVGEFNSPFIGLYDLKNLIITLVRNYIPRSIVIIERNAGGESILEHLRVSPIASNLYYDNNKDLVSTNIDQKLDAQGMLQIQAARRKLYGVWTQNKSRETMMLLLERHVAEYKEKFIGNLLIKELLQLVRTKTGRIEAGPGFHDDAVMAYLMCLYVYYHGNNLHRYGFVKGDIPDKVNANKGLSYEEVLDALPTESREFFKDNFPQFKEPEDYMKQIHSAQLRDGRSFSERTMLGSSMYEINTNNMENDDNEVDLSLFDELNDF